MAALLIGLAVWLFVSIPASLLVARWLSFQNRAEQRYVQIRPKGWTD